MAKAGRFHANNFDMGLGQCSRMKNYPVFILMSTTGVFIGLAKSGWPRRAYAAYAAYAHELGAAGVASWLLVGIRFPADCAPTDDWALGNWGIGR